LAANIVISIQIEKLSANKLFCMAFVVSNSKSDEYVFHYKIVMILYRYICVNMRWKGVNCWINL